MLLTVRETADRLGVSVGLVYSLLTQRKLEYVRVGNGRGRLRIEEDALAAYLARCTFGTQEPEATSISPPKPQRVRLKHLPY